MSFRPSDKLDPALFHNHATVDNPDTALQEPEAEEYITEDDDNTQISLDSRQKMIHVLSSDSTATFIRDFLMLQLLTPLQYNQFKRILDDKKLTKKHTGLASTEAESSVNDMDGSLDKSRNKLSQAHLTEDKYGVANHKRNDNHSNSSCNKDRTSSSVYEGSLESKGVALPRHERKELSTDKMNASSPQKSSKSSLTTLPVPKWKTDKYPNIMNILVMGETGVGKSTFINGIVNYLNYDTMDDALRGGVKVLIDSAFTIADSNYHPHVIRTNATIGVEKGGMEKSNESGELGKSATQEPKSYVFSFGPKENPKYIRIIDTPGIGDTRGPAQDEENFEKILQFISKFSHIHGICILIKPNTARLSVAFRFCIDELLAHLHKSASENILFCFTHTRGSLYKPGDTLPILKQHLEKLQRKTNIAIELSKSTIFSFDNESFRFLCAKKHKYNFSEDDTTQFDKSWKRSTDETRRLFDRASQLLPHSVRDTLSLNNTRNTIEVFLKPLVSIIKTQMTNARLIREREQKIKEGAATGNLLRDSLYVDKVFVNVTELAQPQTVCTSEGCIKRTPIADSDMTINDYVTVCHKNCMLTVQVEKVPNPELKSCNAMNNGRCTKCGCSWDKHMHITYKREETVQKVMDHAVEESIRRKDNAIQTIEIALNECRRNTDDIEQEFAHIRTCCAEFAVFLSANSIISYSDLFIIFIDHAVREEEDVVRRGKDRSLLSDLQNMRQEYENEVRFLKESKMVRSVEEIDELISTLSQLKHCGSVIQEVNKLRLNHINQSSQQEGEIRLDKAEVTGVVRYSRDRTDRTF